MCLCVPSKVLEVCAGMKAIVELNGVRKTIAIDFVPEVKKDQYVLIHAGLALSILEDDEDEV